MSFLPYGTVSFGTWFGAMGGSVAAHVVFIGGFLMLQDANAAQPVANRPPSFTITLEQLDTSALLGITDSTGAATDADPATPEALEPVSSTDAASPETIATEPVTVEPETQVPEADTPAPAPVDPETATPAPASPEAVVPETAAALPPDATLPETVAPAAPDPVAPEAASPPQTAEALAPQAVLPVQPEQSPIMPETLTAGPQAVLPVAPDQTLVVPDTLAAAPGTPAPATAEALAPLASAGLQAQTLTAVAPAAVASAPRGSTGTATTLAPLNPRPQPAAQPSAPRPPAPPPSAQDIALGDLIQRIRSAVADACLLALPRRDGADGVGLALIAAQDNAMESFAQGFLTAEDSALRQTRTLVNTLQCPALTYVRQSADYPATRMGLAIDQTELASGDRLTGVINGGAGRFVTLLLIDDNGVVQDLQRFLAFSGNLVRFDVPVTRNGPARDTRQVLLAIGTDTPPGPLRDRTGQLAADVFIALPDALSTNAALGLATFDVR